MKVWELIKELQKLPQDADVMKSDSNGCEECNPEYFECYYTVRKAEYF